jgi:DNA-binding Lrp family transcriptional regulator
MAVELSDIDRRLLDLLQREIPLVPQPFLQIGRHLGLSEPEVLDRVRALSGPPPAPIRQISAIFDSKMLGYQSCLVAAKVDPARIDDAAKIISQHPGVSHNYKREHAYNLWFTLAVPPDSQLRLAGTIERLRQLSGAEQMRLMPAFKVYKIGVKFDLGGGEGESATSPDRTSTPTAPIALIDADKRIIRVLQQHLPVESRPFDRWASDIGMSVEQLLDGARRHISLGMMRRFSAVLRHREVGLSANAMGVWVVPLKQQDTFGQLAAQNPAVSHCYARPTYPDWPYSLFTMVHGTSRQQCESTLAAISAATGVKDYTWLYSTVEYKKVRVKYFVGDIEEWEAQHAREAQAAT